MKKTLLFFALFLSWFSVNAQTITSKADGAFLNPLTWDCMCIPSTSSYININHNVTLNTDWAIQNGGELNVNATGSLIDDATGRNLLVSNGEFVVNGNADINWIYVESGDFIIGTAVNLSVKSIANYGTFRNWGNVNNVDSLYNGSVFINYENANINVHTFYNADSLVSYGFINNCDSATNAGFLLTDTKTSITRFTNAGTMYNAQPIIFNEFTNIGNSYGVNYNITKNALNIGYWYITDTLTVANDLLNLDRIDLDNNSSLSTYAIVEHNFANIDSINHDAYLMLGYKSQISVGHNFWNADTIWGASLSKISIQDSSANTGKLLGYLDFCDFTPFQTNGSPDYNTGSIDATITFCQYVSANENEITRLNTYPNPCNKNLYIANIKQFHYSIYSTTGVLIKEGNATESIDMSSLAQGTYLLQIEDTIRNRTDRKIISKEN